MRHILVATDFSDTAAAALAQAAKLASLSGAKITLLHVIFADKLNETLLGLDAMEYLSRAATAQEHYAPGQALARLREASEQKLNDQVAGVKGPRPSIETAVAEGRPSVEIAAFAEKHAVDMIVLGTHGRGTLGKAFLGSVADNVIRQAECPVLVVRK